MPIFVRSASDLGCMPLTGAVYGILLVPTFADENTHALHSSLFTSLYTLSIRLYVEFAVIDLYQFCISESGLMAKPGDHWEKKRSQGETATPPTLADIGIRHDGEFASPYLWQVFLLLREMLG